MVKMVGAERLAATVWPTSTSRETTTPSIGERIEVWLKLTSASRSEASACWTWARACWTWACDCASPAPAADRFGHARLVDLGRRLVVTRRGRHVARPRALVVALRDDPALDELLLALEQALGVVALRLERGEVGARARDPGALVLDRRVGGDDLRPRVGQAGARLLEVGAGRGDLRLEDRRVELRHDLPFLTVELKSA